MQDLWREVGVAAAGEYLADLAGDVPVVDEHAARAGLGDRFRLAGVAQQIPSALGTRHIR